MLCEKDFLTHLASIMSGSSLLQSVTWSHWVLKIPLAAVQLPEHHRQRDWVMWLLAITPEMCCCQAEDGSIWLCFTFTKPCHPHRKLFQWEMCSFLL